MLLLLVVILIILFALLMFSGGDPSVPKYARQVVAEHLLPSAPIDDADGAPTGDASLAEAVPLVDPRAERPAANKRTPKKRRVSFNKFIRRRVFDESGVIEDINIPMGTPARV